MNWTLDSLTRQENVVATLESPAVAAAYTRNFEQLWELGRVGGSGDFDTAASDGVAALVLPRPRARAVAPDRQADRRGAPARADRDPAADRRPDPRHARRGGRGAARRRRRRLRRDPGRARCSSQWARNPRSRWKGPLLERCLVAFYGKRSTPYAPGAVHDYMHAKVTVADDTVFLGSFNLSRSGEENAENVLELADAALAGRMAAWIDELRARYPATPVSA